MSSLLGARAEAHDEYAAKASIAKRAPQSASHAVVTGEDVASVPVRTAEDALRLVPGLVLVQHGSEGKGYQFFLRGFDAVHGADLELSVEGIPLNEWSNIHAQGYLDLGAIVPEAIHSVEVTKGPFSLAQGSFAMAGSASYELGVLPHDTGYRGSYTAGTTNRHRVLFSYAPKASNGERFVAADAVKDSGYGENRHVERASTVMKVRLFDSDKKGSITLVALGGVASFGLPGTVRNDDVQAGNLGFYDSYADAMKGQSARAILGLRYDRVHASAVTHALTYGGYRTLYLFENFTGYLADPVHGDFRDQRHEAYSFGAQLEHVQTLHPTFALRAGAGVRGDVLTQKERSVDENDDFVSLRRGLSGVQLSPFAFTGGIWEPIKAFRAEGGARLDLVHVAVKDEANGGPKARGTLAAASPRALLTYRVSPTVKLIAAYGRGLRPPESRAFTHFRAAMRGISEDVAGDSGKPHITQTQSFELGTRIHPSRYYAFDASAFATRIARESIYDHVSATNLELNGARRLGGELVVTSLPLDWLRLSADVTLVDARFIRSGHRVPLAPWLTSGVRALVQHPSGFHAGLRFVGVGARPLPYGARGEPLYLLDGSAGYAWNWLRVDLAVENLLFRDNREGQYYFASAWQRDRPPSQLPSLQYVAGPPANARLTLGVVF